MADNPDVELVLERNEQGFITRAAYTVHNRSDGKAPIEFLNALQYVFGYQEPEESDEAEPLRVEIVTRKGKKVD